MFYFLQGMALRPNNAFLFFAGLTDRLQLIASNFMQVFFWQTFIFYTIIIKTYLPCINHSFGRLLTKILCMAEKKSISDVFVFIIYLFLDTRKEEMEQRFRRQT